MVLSEENKGPFVDDIKTVYSYEGKYPVVPPLQETTQVSLHVLIAREALCEDSESGLRSFSPG